MTQTPTRTVLIRTIEATAKLIDGSELAVARNEDGRLVAALQRPATENKPARTIVYVDPDNHEGYSGKQGEIGPLQPDRSWLNDHAYLLTRALAHLTSESGENAYDLRPDATDANGAREPGTARIRIPSTMKALQVEGSTLGGGFRCILLSASRGAAQTTVAIVCGTQAGANPHIRKVE